MTSSLNSSQVFFAVRLFNTIIFSHLLLVPPSPNREALFARFFRFLEINILNRTLLLLEHLFFRIVCDEGEWGEWDLSVCLRCHLAFSLLNSLGFKLLRGLWTHHAALEGGEEREQGSRHSLKQTIVRENSNFFAAKEEEKGNSNKRKAKTITFFSGASFPPF